MSKAANPTSRTPDNTIRTKSGHQKISHTAPHTGAGLRESSLDRDYLTSDRTCVRPPSLLAFVGPTEQAFDFKNTL
jgi:hypothetical protein